MTRKVLLASAAAAALGTAWGLYYHGAAHVIGIDTQLSEEYAFFSGFGTWLLAAFGFSGGIAAGLRAINCHAHGCPWIGRYPVAGSQYKVCSKHHREIAPAAHRKLTPDVLRKLHYEHLARQQK